MRRRARIEEKLEKLSVADTLNAIRFAEVVVVLMDVERPFEEQDLRIADLVQREGRALVLGMNKWDLVKDGRAGKLRQEADHWLPQVEGVPIVAISGLLGEGLDRLMQGVVDAYAVWNKRVSTNMLNRWFEHAVSSHPPPAVSGRRLKLNYITQVKSRPPSFVLFCTRADAIPESYLRYLVHGMREAFRPARNADPHNLAREGQPVRGAPEEEAMSGAVTTGYAGAQPRRLRVHLHHRAARHAGARHHHSGAARPRCRLHGRRHGGRRGNPRPVRHRLGADCSILISLSWALGRSPTS